MTREILAVDGDAVHQYNPSIRADNGQLGRGSHVLQVRGDLADGENTTTGRSGCLGTREHERDEVGFRWVSVEDL